VLVIKNADNDTGSLDVFLKSLEAGFKETTFILLAQDEKALRKTALSRCSEIRLRPLNDNDAKRLLSRWTEQFHFNSDVLDCVLSYGNGLPGLLRSALDVVVRNDVRNVEGAKRALNVGWGRDAIGYWLKILSGELRPADTTDIFPGILGIEKIQRMRRTFVAIRTPILAGSRWDPVFLGLVPELSALKSGLAECAGQVDVFEGELWASLAREWSKDCYFDNEGLAELVAATLSKLAGALSING
jgi:hypothetical protein